MNAYLNTIQEKRILEHNPNHLNYWKQFVPQLYYPEFKTKI